MTISVRDARRKCLVANRTNIVFYQVVHTKDEFLQRFARNIRSVIPLHQIGFCRVNVFHPNQWNFFSP